MKKSFLLLMAIVLVGCKTQTTTITQEQLWPKGVTAEMREIADNFPSSDPVQERERVSRIANKEAKKEEVKKGLPTTGDLVDLINALIPLLNK